MNVNSPAETELAEGFCRFYGAGVLHTALASLESPPLVQK